MDAENLATTWIQSLYCPAHSDFSKLYVTVFNYFYSGGVLAMSGQPSK